MHKRYLSKRVKPYITSRAEGAAEKLLRGSLGVYWRIIPIQFRRECRLRLANVIEEVRKWRAAHRQAKKEEGCS